MIKNRPPHSVRVGMQWDEYTLDAKGLANVLAYMDDRLPETVAEACRALIDCDRALVLAIATTNTPPARLRESMAEGIRSAERILGGWLKTNIEMLSGEAFCDAVGISYDRTPYWEVGYPSLSPYHVLPADMVSFGYVPEYQPLPLWMHLAGVLRAWTERQIWKEIQVC